MPNSLTRSKWLTTAEACDYTGFSRQTLISKANQGLITGHKPAGSQWRFDRESLDRFFTPDVTKKAVDIVRSLRR